jgi:hypothetical protein
MDVKVTVGHLTNAIAPERIDAFVSEIISELRQKVADLMNTFAQAKPDAHRTLDLENTLHEQLREGGRQVIERLFSELEPAVEEMPGGIKLRKKSYRRMTEKTRRSGVLTRFGKIEIVRARYRRGRSGRMIFPLELLLGIENGFTPAAASRIGKQFAATGSSQGRTLEMIDDQMGERIGAEKLRKLTQTLVDGLEPHRETAQVEKLMNLIEEAREQKLDPVLSVSRDGVALGLAPWSFFEMASVACISVLAGGKKLGTVYLGCTPETNQVTLSNQLTSLLRATIRGCKGTALQIVYVSDAGKVETAYWKNTLRKFYVDGVRIKITRVVDYYHASER